MDSGAAEKVADPATFPDYALHPTDASTSGVEYVGAGGQKIPRIGMLTPQFRTENGKVLRIHFKVAKVNKSIAAVCRIVETGHRVIFDKADGGSYIESKKTGEKTYIRQAHGVY